MTPKISRRNLLIGAAGAAVVLAGCQRPRRWVTLEPYVRPPEEQLAGIATWYASTCRQCPAGCGIVVRLINGRALKIEGNPGHPLNRGKLCARGQAGLQLLYNPDRLTGPLSQPSRGSRAFKPLSWNGALNTLYEKIQAAGSAVAVWGGSSMSGHLYDLFVRFTKALGAPPPLIYDLYGALQGYSSLRAGAEAAFGTAALPTYSLAKADLVLSFGADFLGNGLSAVRYGREFGEFRSQPLGKRGILVQLEPRLSITGAKADLWLSIRPGSEALAARAIAWLIASQEYGSAERVTRAKAFMGSLDIAAVAKACDLGSADLQRLAKMFAEAAHPVAIPGAALTAQPGATDAVAAVQALNLIAGAPSPDGSVALEAGAPQPGFAEVLPGSYADAQALVARLKASEVKVLLVHGANPLYDLPASAGFAEALARVPTVVSFAPLVDETAAWADLILPDRTYLESWGYAVPAPMFGPAALSSQQPVVTPVYDARSTADLLLTIARGLPAAAKALPWVDEVAYLKDLVVALGPGKYGGATPEELWARYLQRGGWWGGKTAAPPVMKAALAAPPTVAMPQYKGDSAQFPYYLCLYPSDLLGDGRGASLPWLQGVPDPMTTLSWQTWVEMHPLTAQKAGLQDGDIVHVVTPYGEVEALLYTYPGVRPDTIALPTGQGHSDLGRYARERGANVMALLPAEAAGEGLPYAGLRAQVAPTGQRARLALFENKEGVASGFINEAFPGGA